MARRRMTEQEKLQRIRDDHANIIRSKIKYKMSYFGTTTEEMAVTIGLISESSVNKKLRDPLNMKVHELMAMDDKLNLGIFAKLEV